MVFYVGYYNADAIRREGRIVAPASENKMGYIQRALREACGGPIEIVTPAETRLHRYIRGRRILLCDRTELKTFSTFSSRFKLLRGLGHLWTRTRFVLYLLKHLKPEDHLIVYHSLAYMRLFKLIKRIKGCALTIEVEEIYADVKENEALKKKELASLQTADSYIFITELLREKVNREKPAVISHGTYRPLPDHGFRFDDDRIHVVYAGTFCKIKGGAYAAIAAAEYSSGATDTPSTFSVFTRNTSPDESVTAPLSAMSSARFAAFTAAVSSTMRPVPATVSAERLLNVASAANTISPDFTVKPPVVAEGP